MFKQRKFSFWEIGEYKQQTSKTKAEAELNLKCSCARCNKASRCNENYCTIYKAYQLKLLMFEAEKVPKSFTIVKTRKYNITSESQQRKQALRKLTKLYNFKELHKFSKEVERQIELKIDEASVFLQMEDYNSALIALIKIKALKTAKEIATIVNKEVLFNELLCKLNMKKII